jgi:hypothetical protein
MGRFPAPITMLIADLFGLEELFLLEPSFERLVDPVFTDQFLALDAKEGRVLIDKEERPLAVAVKTDKWYATSLMYREPTDALTEAVAEMELEFFQTERSQFAGALREYFSVLMAETVTPASEDFAQDRMDKVVSLLHDTFGKSRLRGRTCLDVGCGTGLGSAAIHELGMHALSYDMDDGLLVRGLQAGRLFHQETMRIDASQAAAYLEPVDYGLILMAGKITEFNSYMWKQIVKQTMDLSKVTLITVETEPEARMILPWCEGRKAKVIENKRDPFYDRWTVLIK